jgi:hypothetical protein
MRRQDGEEKKRFLSSPSDFDLSSESGRRILGAFIVFLPLLSPPPPPLSSIVSPSSS